MEIKRFGEQQFSKTVFAPGDGFTFQSEIREIGCTYKFEVQIDTMNAHATYAKEPKLPLCLWISLNKIPMFLGGGWVLEYSEGLVALVSSPPVILRLLGNLCTRGQCYLLGGNALHLFCLRPYLSSYQFA